MSIRPDYCPVGNVPCQSLCAEPCATRARTLADEALMRQALDALVNSWRELPVVEKASAITALRARLETSNV